MRFAHFFVDRPIFASVLSVAIMLVGAVAYNRLPVAQYPEIAPPTISVSASYPGASAEVVAATVAAPIEQEINGVDGAIYMSSNATEDGRLSISVTFALGTNLDQAQVEVQNRVAIATPRLPEEVRRLGVTVRKNSPDLMMVINVLSPDNSRDQLWLSNFSNIEIRDRLLRVDGVGSIQVFGSRDYSMRIWLDPDRLAARNMTASDVVAALQRQNVQVSSGVINQPPMESSGAFQVAVRTQGRLADPDEFATIVVKTDREGRTTLLKDVARVELAAQDYSTKSYLARNEAVGMGVFQKPGSNALKTEAAVQAAMREIARDFPPGVKYDIVYNPTRVIQESVDAVRRTIFEAIGLVVLVIVLFLQTWRAAIVPILAIPVSLVGTFAVMDAAGFSLNNLSLFGLVLAIGIVVDDAIVVVENVERNLAQGMSPVEATHKTMDEVGGALVAIALVLCAVFVPVAFVTGISGQFYRQFALTIAASTVISAFNSLTLSPALCALLLKPHTKDERHSIFTWPFRMFFRLFNWSFDGIASGYGWLTGRLVRLGLLVLIAYGGLLYLTVDQFQKAPRGFIPAQERGFYIVAIQLPPGSSIDRTDAVTKRVVDTILKTPGFRNAVGIVGFSGATFTNAPNAAAVFAATDDIASLADRGFTPQKIVGMLFGALAPIQEAFIIPIAPPPVQGIGNAGGVRMIIQDRTGAGSAALADAVQAVAGRAAQTPGIERPFFTFETRTPQIYLDIDRTKAQMLGVNMTDAFRTLEIYLGSSYVNDFNFLGKTFRVTAQADQVYRNDSADILRLRVRNQNGDNVPFASFAQIRETAGPARVPRYNLYPAAEIDASTAPGYSSGQTIQAMEQIAREVLPPGMSFEWTGLAWQQIQAGDTGLYLFVLAVVFVFLVLAAQYESLTLPFAVILIVPLCLLAGVTGTLYRGLDVNILTQVGFVVLVGLAAKNAILIVEFAKQLEDAGANRFEAATRAARLRLRPIVMTSLAFILGVFPLVTARGAGAEMRQAIGTAVFAGMIGVTLFGLLFTPTFYVVCRRIALIGRRREPRGGAAATPAPAE
ncbi:MAG: multidrug efflux RND transporter permease subunit [Alsobacter sp.]